MMIKIKNLFAVFLFLGFLVSCSTNPEDLAKEYCQCRADIDKGIKTENDCAGLAESHTLKIQDEPHALKTYTSKVLDCISSPVIPTKK